LPEALEDAKLLDSNADVMLSHVVPTPLL